jgi:hypothetical protein
MRIAAVKIGKHWYRAVSALPVCIELYPLFPVTRTRSKHIDRLKDFNDAMKYTTYNMKRKRFFTAEKTEQPKPF